MSGQSAAGRRRSNISSRQYSAEDQALNMISKEAEARLAAKRAARAEAREIRMKEIEKQQKQSEEKQDRIYELTSDLAAAKVRQQLSGSRRGSTESTDSASDAKDVDFKAEVRDLEEKYKAAMMSSAQLDNEKQSLVYQVELLKDQLEEQEEGYTVLQKEYKDKCRDCDFQKRDLESMQHELSILKQQLEIKDRLIEESGFVIMSNDKGEPVLERQSSETAGSRSSSNGPLPTGAFLVSPETKTFLEKAGDGSLGTCTAPSVAVQHSTNKTVGVSPKSAPSMGSAPGQNEKLDQTDGGESSVDKVGNEEKGGSGDGSRADAGTVHDTSLVITSADVVCEHDVLTSTHGGDGETKGQPAGKEEEEVGKAVEPLQAGHGDGKSDHESPSTAAGVPSISISSIRSKQTEEDSDEGDEFYDAFSSTPSPFDSKSGKDFELPQCPPEGSSVDSEPPCPLQVDTSSARNSQSLEVQDVTEGESHTETSDESAQLQDPPLQVEEETTLKKDNGTPVDELTKCIDPQGTEKKNDEEETEERVEEDDKTGHETGETFDEAKEPTSPVEFSPDTSHEELEDLRIVEDNEKEELKGIENESQNLEDSEEEVLKVKDNETEELKVEETESEDLKVEETEGEEISHVPETAVEKSASETAITDEVTVKEDDQCKEDSVEHHTSNEEKGLSSEEGVSQSPGLNDATEKSNSDIPVTEPPHLSVTEEQIRDKDLQPNEGTEDTTPSLELEEDINKNIDLPDSNQAEEKVLVSETSTKSSQLQKSLSIDSDGADNYDFDDIDDVLDASGKDSETQETPQSGEPTTTSSKELSSEVAPLSTKPTTITAEESHVKETPPSAEPIKTNKKKTEAKEAPPEPTKSSKKKEAKETPSEPTKTSKKKAEAKETPPESTKSSKKKTEAKEAPPNAESKKSSKKKAAAPVAPPLAEPTTTSTKETIPEKPSVGIQVTGAEGGLHDKTQSQDSLETEDLEGALDKSMKEKDDPKGHKKSKKFGFFKKVFK